MAYQKQEFINNKTTLKAEHLNHIENGIVNLENALVSQPGRGIAINGETSNDNINVSPEPDIFGGLLHYLLNINADTNGKLVDYSGRMTIGEWIPTYGKQLTVIYNNTRLPSNAIRYVNEDRTTKVDASESVYARIVFYNSADTTPVTADVVDETTVTINGNNYALMAGVLDDYINDGYLEDLENKNEIEDSTPEVAPAANTIISIDELLVSTTEDYAMQIFEKIVCIGDSLTAGFTNKNGTTYGSNTARPTKRNWVGYLGDRLNKTITNLGYGSTTTHSWRFADDGLGANITQATTLTDTDCYIVGLGFNDRSGKVVLGSVSDIQNDKSTNADTFYGNYDYIVSSLLNVNSKVHVFLLTAASPVPSDHPYNVAIRTIAALYPSRVHLIDLAADYDSYFSTGIISATFNGHFFPLTYQLTSMVIQKAISHYMIVNYNKFYGTPWNGM